MTGMAERLPTLMADRLPALVEMRRENQLIVRQNAEDPVKDRNGACTSRLSLQLRFFAVAEYFLHGDVEAFRSQLSEAAALRNDMFVRWNNGEPIDGSYVTMLSYKALFNALAAGDMELAEQLASHMGGRDELEKHHDHPFDYAMGYTLRAFVIKDSAQMREWTPKLKTGCHKTRSEAFLGYAELFEAILADNTTAGNEAMKSIVKGHRKLSKGRGVFSNTVDEVLCVWGIGIRNLAWSHGVRVEGVPPLIPNDLLV